MLYIVLGNENSLLEKTKQLDNMPISHLAVADRQLKKDIDRVQFHSDQKLSKLSSQLAKTEAKLAQEAPVDPRVKTEIDRARYDGDRKLAKVTSSLAETEKKLFQVECQASVTQSALDKVEKQLSRALHNYNSVLSQNKSLAGDMALIDPVGIGENITAAELNAAAVGTVKRYFTVDIQSAAGQAHTWANFTPVLTPDVAVGTFTVPTLNSPSFLDGKIVVEVTFITDEGVGENYSASDSITVDLQVQAPGNVLDDTWLGLPCPKFTKTFTVT